MEGYLEFVQFVIQRVGRGHNVGQTFTLKNKREKSFKIYKNNFARKTVTCVDKSSGSVDSSCLNMVPWGKMGPQQRVCGILT